MSTDRYPRPITDEQLRDALLRWRGIEEICKMCGGSGVRVYGSTATWRGGIGGAAITPDQCDRCWGSGDARHTWTDLRKLRDDESRRVAERAATRLADAAGASLSTMRPAVIAIADELERLARGRKERPRYFYEACAGLARTLREAVKTAEGDDKR